MKITDTLHYGGQDFQLEYHDAETFDALPYERCRQVYGLCFDAAGQLVIGFGGHKKAWGLIGGTIEPGETFLQTLHREIQEESNMEVLAAKPVGYQKVVAPDGTIIYQLRYWCRVRPFGEFISDPAGSVTAIKLVDPKSYKRYFDWGKIGERLVQRALEAEQHQAPSLD